MKALQMNVQHCLIQKIMLYKFEWGHKAMEENENIFCVKDEGAVDLSTVSRSFKKFLLGFKNLNNQSR